jgi:hypothetical protein
MVLSFCGHGRLHEAGGRGRGWGRRKQKSDPSNLSAVPLLPDGSALLRSRKNRRGKAETRVCVGGGGGAPRMQTGVSASSSLPMSLRSFVISKPKYALHTQKFPRNSRGLLEAGTHRPALSCLLGTRLSILLPSLSLSPPPTPSISFSIHN